MEARHRVGAALAQQMGSGNCVPRAGLHCSGPDPAVPMPQTGLATKHGPVSLQGSLALPTNTVVPQFTDALVCEQFGSHVEAEFCFCSQTLHWVMNTNMAIFSRTRVRAKFVLEPRHHSTLHG